MYQNDIEWIDIWKHCDNMKGFARDKSTENNYLNLYSSIGFMVFHREFQLIV